VEVAAHWHAQNTGGSRMRPVAKYMAKSGAIHRNQIKAASRNATMPDPVTTPEDKTVVHVLVPLK
jgi:hypothetical protein